MFTKLACIVVLAAATLAPVRPLAAVQIRDINGRLLTPFSPDGQAHVLLFVTSDCPVSNAYAPEMQRICGEYSAKGVGCSLLYEDMRIDARAVRAHLDEYRYRGIPAAIDADRRVAREAKASITPQAVVVDARGAIRYRGRIDNFYAALGKPRQVVTSHDLRDALDAVLAGRPVPVPETAAVGCFIVSPATGRNEIGGPQD